MLKTSSRPRSTRVVLTRFGFTLHRSSHDAPYSLAQEEEGEVDQEGDAECHGAGLCKRAIRKLKPFPPDASRDELAFSDSIMLPP